MLERLALRRMLWERDIFAALGRETQPASACLDVGIAAVVPTQRDVVRRTMVAPREGRL
jgi:hypothetical protein